MNTATSFAAPLCIAACAVLSLAARAQTVSDATAESLLRSAASTPNAAEANAPSRPLWLQRRAADLSSLRVIELPDEQLPLGPRARKHHALTWRNDALSNALDNAGLAHAECHNRVRLPSRLGRSPDGGSAVQLKLQLAIGCSF